MRSLPIPDTIASLSREDLGMAVNRLEIMHKVLERLGVEVWRTLRYGNDTGTCIRTVSGTMVMVPDDPNTPYFMQASGADELKALADPVFETLYAEAMETASAAGARSALLAAADALYQEGYDAGYLAATVAARQVFEAVVVGKYGAMPEALSARIRSASLEDMARWAARMPHARHATALIT